MKRECSNIEINWKNQKFNTPTKRLFQKDFAVTLGTSRSPLTPLKRGGTGIKVTPLFKVGTGIKVSLKKGDLEGSKTFDTNKIIFQTSSNDESECSPQ
ncbi:hypothetical protein NSTC745_03984 [Nostoc sp. DSM 114161]|jgi:hypothetical protein